MIKPEVRISPYIGVCVYVTLTLGNTFWKQFYLKMHSVKTMKFNTMINLGKWLRENEQFQKNMWINDAWFQATTLT
jgi:hypothetical protein